MIEISITWRNGEITMQGAPTIEEAIGVLDEVARDNKASKIELFDPETGQGFTATVSDKTDKQL